MITSFCVQRHFILNKKVSHIHLFSFKTQYQNKRIFVRSNPINSIPKTQDDNQLSSFFPASILFLYSAYNPTYEYIIYSITYDAFAIHFYENSVIWIRKIDGYYCSAVLARTKKFTLWNRTKCRKNSLISEQ